MSYDSIKDKLKLYNHTHVKGEVRSSEYEASVKQKKRLNIKLDLADTLFNEVYFPFTNSQKEHVKELIRIFQNFKELHSQASNEEIILSFILYVKSLETKQNMAETMEGQKTIRTIITDVERQLLFQDKFEIITWKINLHYISCMPILPTEPKNIDHNLLYKGKLK